METVSFSVMKIEDEFVTVKDLTTQQTQEIRVNQTVGDWTLMATINEEDASPIAVFENHKEKCGSIIYINPEGVVLQLWKTLEPTRVPLGSCYRGRTLEEVLKSDEDFMGNEILAEEGDPSWEKVAPCLPPLRFYTFVGTRECIETPDVGLEGYVGRGFNPTSFMPQLPSANKGVSVDVESEEIIKRGGVHEGLIGDWLPVIRRCFPYGEGKAWEEVVFAEVNPSLPSNRWNQPTWIRLVRVEDGMLKEVHYFDSFIPYPPSREPAAEEFYRELLFFYKYWKKQLSSVIEIKVPEKRIENLCLNTLVREMITCIGYQPRSGILLGYGEPCAGGGGSQDQVSAAVGCFLEWGLFEDAKGVLDYYLTNYIRDDGSIFFFANIIGETGRLLTTIAKYYEYTKDKDLFLKHERKISAIVNRLLILREEAKNISAEDPTYGMIRGHCEYDQSFLPNPYSNLLPYYSNSTEVYRALHDLGEVWMKIGYLTIESRLVDVGRKLLKEAEELKKDILISIERSILQDLDLPHLPGVAGAKVPYDVSRKNEFWAPAGVINGRCYSEMLYSGVLTRSMVETIIHYQSKHNGRVLGIPSGYGVFMQHTTVGYAYGLLQQDLVREFLLTYYALLAHAYARGTFTASESGNVNRSTYLAPYETNAQLVIPALTRWMLIFEDPNEPILWLARGIPRQWLEEGKKVSVQNAPTRWGKVTFEIYSEVHQKKKVTAFVGLPEIGFEANINLRTRTLGKLRMSSVTVNGREWKDFDPEQEIVSLPSGSHGRITIEISFAEHV